MWSGIIWLFRDEFPELELGNLRSLIPVLTEAYEIARVESARSDSDENAFRSAVRVLGHYINYRMVDIGRDAELERLKEVVDSADVCDPIKQIFQHIARNSKNVHRSNSCRTVALDREWLTNHPIGESRPGVYSDPYHISARTRVVGETAVVELQVYLDRFDVVSLLAVPALFTHELVCHAHAREDRNNDHSLWAEGMMDWVASYFFEKWVVKLDMPYGLTKIHGGYLRDQRMTRWRYTGRLAADRLVSWLMQDSSVRHVSVAKAVCANFALQVNLTNAPLPVKDKLASRLNIIQRDKSLQEAIRSWRHGEGTVDGCLA